MFSLWFEFYFSHFFIKIHFFSFRNLTFMLESKLSTLPTLTPQRKKKTLRLDPGALGEWVPLGSHMRAPCPLVSQAVAGVAGWVGGKSRGSYSGPLLCVSGSCFPVSLSGLLASSVRQPFTCGLS